MRALLSASLFLALAACGQAAAPADAGAQTSAGVDVSDTEKSAMLAALGMRANGQGQVENECGELVTPQFIATDVGAGRSVAFVMTGGPTTISCYGDGPLVLLMHNAGGSWRQVYMNRGGPMIVLASQHNGANDLADGGPGFSFPVWEWNGNEYAPAHREVADSALGDARFVP